jgi:hypothetical protein
MVGMVGSGSPPYVTRRRVGTLCPPNARITLA